MQGTQKVFFLNSGRDLKRRKIIPMIASDRIIKIVEDWGGIKKIAVWEGH